MEMGRKFQGHPLMPTREKLSIMQPIVLIVSGLYFAQHRRSKLSPKGGGSATKTSPA